jgi:type I restriction enzyme S subunit
LDCLSGIIEKKKQQLKEYDALAQSIFYEMFGDPVENEKGWEIEKLSNKAEISSSKRIFASEYTDSGVPFYRGKEITEKSKGNPITIELYISLERYNEIKFNYGVPTIGDILVTAVGTIGNIWVVDSDETFYFKDGNVLWIKIKDDTNPIYFKYILTILIDEYKEMMANGCAYSALTIANLKEMPTCVIPLSLQQEFASKIEAIEKQKELIKKSIEDVETLFNSKMEYYFN